MIDLGNLNDAQKGAVMATVGPVLIIAGAGAGKTKTITYRIAHLIDTGVKPQNILAITFTNKAASEMRQRALDLLPTNITSKPMIATFHAFCVRILREYAALVGRNKSFTIMDEDDAKGLIKEIVEGFGLEAKQWESRKIKAIISREKNDGRNWQDLKGNVSSNFETTLVNIWERYEAMTFRGAERLTPTDETETRFIPLRGAAAENIRQWAK